MFRNRIKQFAQHSFRDKHWNLKRHRNLWKCATIYCSISASWKLQIFPLWMILHHLDKINLLSLPALLSLFSAAQYFSLIPCFSVEGRIRPLLLAHSKGQDWTADDRGAAASGCTLPWPVPPTATKGPAEDPGRAPSPLGGEDLHCSRHHRSWLFMTLG